MKSAIKPGDCSENLFTHAEGSLSPTTPSPDTCNVVDHPEYIASLVNASEELADGLDSGLLCFSLEFT